MYFLLSCSSDLYWPKDLNTDTIDTTDTLSLSTVFVSVSDPIMSLCVFVSVATYTLIRWTRVSWSWCLLRPAEAWCSLVPRLAGGEWGGAWVLGDSVVLGECWNALGERSKEGCAPSPAFMVTGWRTEHTHDIRRSKWTWYAIIHLESNFNV